MLKKGIHYVSKSGSAPMRKAPLTGMKIAEVPQFARVNIVDERVREFVQGDWFVEVLYYTMGKLTPGWMYEGYLDPYVEMHGPYPVKVDFQTETPFDPVQYITYRNQIQYNLCGELSVLYCTGWDLSVSQYLDKIYAAINQAKNASRWKEFLARVFPSNKSKGTGLDDLDLMLSDYDDFTRSTRLDFALYDHNAGRPIVSPYRYQEILKHTNIISGCRVNTQTGRLNGGGSGHWVVLEDVFPDRFGGTVLLFNPMIGMEEYSWNEWIATSPQPYGILVERSEG